MPAQLLPQHALYRYIFGELNATKCNYHGTLFSVHALDNLTLLEPDVQDLTAIAHEPSSSRICKSNCPVAAHFGQLEPSATLIRRPGGSSGLEVRFRLGGNHNGTAVVMVVVESSSSFTLNSTKFECQAILERSAWTYNAMPGRERMSAPCLFSLGFTSTWSTNFSISGMVRMTSSSRFVRMMAIFISFGTI